jgi:hypothetical protein
MKAPALFGVFYLFGGGESYFVSLRVLSVSRDKQPTIQQERKLHVEDYDATRRKYLMNSLITAVSPTFIAQPVLATSTSPGTGSDSGMATTKNKKIGGLALKIRSVGHIMVS